jgi:hypothetical protein
MVSFLPFTVTTFCRNLTAEFSIKEANPPPALATLPIDAFGKVKARSR